MKKVLVVDNDELILQFINDLLSKEGHQVMTAEDGLSALDILKINVPDVILVDLVMPNIDGKKLCKIIRGMKKLKGVYIIILSATLAEQKINIAELGANACVAKGPLNQMAQHILSVIDQPDLASARCLAGQVIGIEGISPRRITGELLSVKRHFEVVLGRMSEGILEVTSEGRIVYANPSALSLIGVPEKELLGSSLIELFAADDRQRVAELTKTIDDRPKTIPEDSPVSLSGYQVTLNILPIDGEELTSIIINDVTERKQAEEALGQSEERYRSILDSVEEGYFEVDLTGKFTFFNDSLLKMSRISRDELLGMDNREYMTPDSAKKIYHIFREIYETGKPAQKVEHQIITKDGRHRVHELSASLMQDREGHPIGFRGVVRDVSERKQAEEALQESEVQKRAILDASVDRIRLVDRDMRIIWANKTTTGELDITPEDLVGHHCYKFFVDRDSPCPKCPTMVALDSGKIEHSVFHQPKSKGIKGESYWDVHAVPIKNDSGDIVNIIEISRNITETKRVEEEKKKLEAQFQAAQRIEAIGTLAGGIAHEFNNALVGITGNIELLKMDLPESECIDKYIKPMKASTRRMANLSNQLLAYAQGGKYQERTISLTGFVEDTLPLIQNTIDPAIRVETDLSRDILDVSADQTQLQMVLSAVVENATEAIEGEGRIKIITRDEEIDDDFAKTDPELKPGPYACLTIEDDGKGMDEETKGKIFDPFFTTKFQGRGLGMAAVHGIVRNHGGWISVDSELGKGTMVRIYLPAIVPLCGTEASFRIPELGSGAGLRLVEPEKKEVKEPKTEVTIGTRTVLVIEDEEMVMDVARAMLERLGYRVLETKTGMEAVNLAKTFDGDIDLALLDMKLPDMEGGKVYPLIKEARPNLKVIVCSGYSIDGPAEDILNAGAQDFIQKPFSMAGLSAKLEEVLTHS